MDGVDVLRAPYEADAQLAFLAKTGHIKAILTEDSDMIAYPGVKTVLLKLDRNSSSAQQLVHYPLIAPSLPSSSAHHQPRMHLNHLNHAWKVHVSDLGLNLEKPDDLGQLQFVIPSMQVETMAFCEQQHGSGLLACIFSFCCSPSSPEENEGKRTSCVLVLKKSGAAMVSRALHHSK